MKFCKIRKVCIYILVIVLLLVFSCLAVEGERVYATSLSDITSDSISSKKEEIESAAKEQSNIKNSISDMEEIVGDLQSKKADLNKYITSIDSAMEDIQDNIDAYEAMIAEAEAELIRKEAELEAAEEQEEAQYDIMQRRIQYLYECGDMNYLEAILNADSFADMLNRAEYVEEMAAYDNQMLHEYILQREYIQLCKESVEQERVTLDESKAALETEKDNLEVVREQKENDLAVYEHDIALTEAQIKELEEELEFQTNLISQLEGEITEEQKQILAEKGIVLEYDGGAFHWPAPSYTVITSEFGWRTDPIDGSRAYHNGVDMAAAKGTPIVAAYDGIVTDAGYNWSMGNYVIIDHGTGLYTIYMHASKLHVSKDDIVAGGELIAAIGSTGRSTGPHLHFSVRLNGVYVSPWDYLNK